MSKAGFSAKVIAQQVAILCCLVLPHDPLEDYFRRGDGVTFGAGDAKSINSATHMINPWPPYVGNTRIPGNGERMSGAIERYRDVSKLPRAPRPIATESGATSSVTSSTPSKE